jgi:hypothetical protein
MRFGVLDGSLEMLCRRDVELALDSHDRAALCERLDPDLEVAGPCHDEMVGEPAS